MHSLYRLDGLTEVSGITLAPKNECNPLRILMFIQDLGVSGAAYNTSLALYFLGYLLFEIPSNVRRLLPLLTHLGILIGPSSSQWNTDHVGVIYSLYIARDFNSCEQFRLKRFNPQFWLPLLTLAWGIISVCQGLVTDQASLFGIRFLLGATEAGLFPGCVFLFSVYYRR